MLGSRLTLAAPLVGLVAGALVWLVFSHGAAASARIGDLQTRAAAIQPPPAPAVSASGGFAAANPIFAMTTGPKAIADTVIVLTGIQRTPVHTAALLSINGKAPQWIELGQTKDDVTLDEVDAEKVVVDTPIGQKDIRLGDHPAASPPGSGSANGGSPDRPPPGFHVPPPPASAPRT